MIRLLLSSLGELAAERGWRDAFWARANFFAWVCDEPLVRFSPHAYLLDDPPPPPRPKMWQTWLSGHKPPRWAVEIVSEDWKKDYDEAPLKYAQLGAREFVMFDPEVALNLERRGPRVPLQVYGATPTAPSCASTPATGGTERPDRRRVPRGPA